MSVVPFLDDVFAFDQCVCEEVNWLFGDAEEIGSSDINACVRNILRNYYDDVDAVSDGIFSIVRRSVQCAIGNLDYIRANY